MSEGRAEAPIVVTGIAEVVAANGERLNAVPYLVEKKSKKYLGRQDELAVISAGRALAHAGLIGGDGRAKLGDRTGLFISVGYIPFKSRDIDPVLARSVDDDGRFSMQRFAAEGYQRAHPLLAFRCLPNMPAFHIAANFGIEGPYHVAYPSDGQLLLALERAVIALRDQHIDRALVTGVAHQKNFLVEHHHRRLGVDPDTLVDAGATAVLEREGERDHAVVARLADLDIGYAPFDPLRTVPDATSVGLGPAAPLIALARGQLEHTVKSRDGIVGRVRWTS